MNFRIPILVSMVLGVLILAAPRAAAMAKAYDLISYKGKAGGVTIVFEFAAGYPSASKVSMTTASTGKTAKFNLDDPDKMHFVAEAKG